MVVHPLESSAKRSRSIRGALPSVALHAAIILAAVHATAHAALPHTVPTPPGVVQFVPTEPPPDGRPSSSTSSTASASRSDVQAIHARVPVVPPLTITSPTAHFDVGSSAPVINSTEFGRGVAPAGYGVRPDVGSAPVTVADVDRPVAPLDGPPNPTYPEPLRASGIRGSVTAEFVVDTTGRVEPTSFHVLDSDNDLFSAAVRTAVLYTRFRSAEAGGRRVRQMVQQRFSFTLQ